MELKFLFGMQKSLASIMISGWIRSYVKEQKIKLKIVNICHLENMIVMQKIANVSKYSVLVKVLNQVEHF